MSMDDAVARARAIAARLSGQPQQASPAEPSKRKRWDDAVKPSSSAAPPASSSSSGATGLGGILPGLEDTQKRMKQAAQKRVWVAVSDERPASHYRLYWKQHPFPIPNNDPTIHAELNGRGSTGKPPLPGVPEEPLHVLLEGPATELLEPHTHLVEEYLAKAKQAPLLQDEQDKEVNNSNGNNSNNHQTSSSATDASSSYRPAPVAALIHHHPAMAGGGELMEEQIGVPNGVVGYIIGRGGESIASMQARTGCKVQIQKEHDMNPGQTQRVITLQATTKQAIDACRSIIEGMVQERIQTTSSGGGGGGGNNPASQDAKLREAVAAGHVLVTVEVPDTDVGLVIGKAGATIKGIQDRSGANVQIPQTGDPANPTIRTVSITHPNQEGAQLAKQLIHDILGTKRNQVPHVTIQVEIPDKDVGMCIGRSGCVIREMQNQTHTKIQIPSFSTPGQTTRIATVVGPAEGCAQVKQMIERIILEQSSQSVMSGGYDPYGGGGGGGAGGYGGGGYGGGYGSTGYGADAFGGAYNYSGQQQQQHHQQQQQQQGGQRDYSAEWAAYYAAQAAQTGGQASTAAPAAATATTAATTAAASGAAAAAPAAAGADSYYEAFHRYAYYYGEDAARKYYGAWSPPAGTPNPYGVNPNGITPAPAPSAAAAASPAAAAAAPSGGTDVRDTGKRGVSNLPAWMTK